MLLAIPFPAIDPVLIEIGPLAIRWYALAYIGGIVGGWWLAKRLVALPPPVATQEQLSDAVTWVTLGIILGGRLGYVLFYQPGYYLAHPAEILVLWQGGMAFHGGALGVVIALWIWCGREDLDRLGFGDRVVSVVPIGLCFGRLANFVNGELWGRVTEAPWGMVFPTGGPLPRHPSQIYQAMLEGVVLFALCQAAVWTPRLRARRGFTIGVFLAGYGLARTVGELFRQPDGQLGFLIGGLTMGQLLSAPMVLLGVWLMVSARPAPAAAIGSATQGG